MNIAVQAADWEKGAGLVTVKVQNPVTPDKVWLVTAAEAEVIGHKFLAAARVATAKKAALTP